MPKRCAVAIVAFGILFVVAISSARAIDTTYGEDPVPNSKCYEGFIDLGYGIDPIPAKTPAQRWQAWRASRGLAPTIGIFKRQVGQSRFAVPAVQTPSEPPFPPGTPRPSARRNRVPGQTSSPR